MSRYPQASRRGTVSLVALCFVAVLGIVLASYIAVCSRSMNMSNRAFQDSVGRQLAEYGFEEGLRALNQNYLSGTNTNAPLADWNRNGVTANWTLDTTNKRASCTITFPASKFGQGITASVKIRIDNYDVALLDAAWNSSTNYLPDNVVSYTDGKWYRCIGSNTNKTPSFTTSASTYWIHEQNSISDTFSWRSGTSYVVGNMALRSGAWYRCKNNHTASSANQPPDGASWSSYWVATPGVTADGDLLYSSNSIVRYYVATYGNDSWYRYTGSGWDNISSSSWSLTWHWQQYTNYVVGNIISYNNVWYRCKADHSSGGGSFSSTNWDSVTTLAASFGNNWTWNTTYAYSPNDVAYYASRWYRCVVANQSQTPSTTSSYWATSPRQSVEWDSGLQYNQYDTVRYNGVWYLSLLNSNLNQNPATASNYWIGANTTNTGYIWNSSTAYAANAYRCYGGAWYKSSAASTNKAPNVTAYWSPSWTQSSGVKSGAPILYVQSTVAIAGSPSIVAQRRATLAPAPLFSNAVAATSDLVMNSGTVDSYDSGAGTYGGSNVGSSAVLAAGSTLTINSGMTIKGYLAWPSPPAGINGTVTLNGAAYSTDKSRVSRSPMIPSFAIHSVPGGVQLSATTATLGIAGSVTPSVYYYTSGSGSTNLSLNSSGEILTIAGPTILYVPGNFRINSYSDAGIKILPTGSLRLVVGRDFRVESSGGGIDNQTLDPAKCTILCSRVGSDTFEYTGSASNPSLYGTIYVPNSPSTLTIGDGTTIYGAVSAQSIACTGTATIHYDTALRYHETGGVDQPYSITDWRVLSQSELATMP